MVALRCLSDGILLNRTAFASGSELVDPAIVSDLDEGECRGSVGRAHVVVAQRLLAQDALDGAFAER